MTEGLAPFECCWCGALTDVPVWDEGDQAWLPGSEWRVWCTESCHTAAAEDYWTRRWTE